MNATVYIEGNSYEVDGALYQRGTPNGWVSVDNWTKIFCDVFQVFYPSKYGIEENNFYRLQERDNWVPREELVKILSPEIIQERKLVPHVSPSNGRNKWENEPGFSADDLDW